MLIQQIFFQEIIACLLSINHPLAAAASSFPLAAEDAMADGQRMGLTNW